MREKRHVGNLQGAEQLNRRHSRRPQAHQRRSGAGHATRGLVVGGLRGFTGTSRPMTGTRTTPCSAFERSPVATVRMRGITAPSWVRHSLDAERDGS